MTQNEFNELDIEVSGMPNGPQRDRLERLINMIKSLQESVRRREYPSQDRLFPHRSL
jgi:hypothetical protein